MTVGLDWQPTGRGIEFTGWSGHPLPTFPVRPDPSKGVPSAVRLLEELWGRNLVTRTQESAALPWDVVYELDRHEHALLGLPEVGKRFRADVQTDRWLSAADFRIRVVVSLDGPHPSPIPESRRKGLVFELNGGRALPPQEIGELILLLDEPLPQSPDERSLIVAEVKRLAEQSPQILLDHYLEKEDYIVPDRMGVDVVATSPDEIRVRATAEGVEENDFRGFVDGPARTVYTHFGSDGRRRRLVLKPGQREAVSHLQRNGALGGADVPAFLANPEAFLPDDIEVDHSEFSRRVRGLVPVVYRSQPYVSVSPGKRRGWFDAVPGVRVSKVGPPQEEDGTSAEEPTDEPDPDIAPDEFRELVEQAEQDGKQFVRFRDGWLEVDPVRARPFLDFLDENAAIDDEGRRLLDASGRQYVLDVFANTEALEYAEPDGDPVPRPDIPDYDTPRSLHGKLYPHQKLGYSWMRHLHKSGWGGLLADDMGLGKTIQIIAFLSHLHDLRKLRPALIIAPVAVIANWQRELQRFAPGIGPAHEHRGAQREKRNPQSLARHQVVITSYATLRRDQLLLGRVDWSVVACDEAQNVKNPTAGVTSAIKGMKARFRLACTGTPVENGLSELWCIVDFAQPGRLGSRTDFRQEFEQPLVAASEEGTDASGLVDRLRSRLNPHYIRRTKEEVLDLPPKTKRSYEVAMSPRQAAVYDKILLGVKSRAIHPLAGLQHLIAICSHPAVFNGTASEDDPGRLLKDAPKLAQTVEIVESIRQKREKVVIYTRLRAIQRILQVVLRDRFRFEARVLNGLVTGYNRHRIVDAFNDRPGFDVMILSPEAAGIGLNITGATHVIHYTRLWNPAKENQATDRVHRIGQDRPVCIHYPVVSGGGFKSVEQHLHDLLTEKRDLARNVLAPRKSLDVTGELERRVTGTSQVT